MTFAQKNKGDYHNPLFAFLFIFQHIFSLSTELRKKP